MGNVLWGRVRVAMCTAGVQVGDLDPNGIQSAVDEANRHNYKMLKTRANDGVVKALKVDLDDFKEQLPLLQEVRLCGFSSTDTLRTFKSVSGIARFSSEIDVVAYGTRIMDPAAALPWCCLPRHAAGA